jgi:hypothetical protein
MITPATLLTPTDAVREIGGRRTSVQAWLEAQGLIHDVPGLGKRVIWGEVLEAIRTPAEHKPGPPSRLSRAGLRRT